MFSLWTAAAVGLSIGTRVTLTAHDTMPLQHVGETLAALGAMTTTSLRGQTTEARGSLDVHVVWSELAPDAPAAPLSVRLSVLRDEVLDASLARQARDAIDRVLDEDAA